MPVNAFDAHFHSFQEQVLREATRRGMAGRGMKPMSGHGEPIEQGELSAEEALRYAMSLPVTTTITGMDKPEILQQNLKIAQGFKPMTAGEMQALRERTQLVAEGMRWCVLEENVKVSQPP